MAEETFDGFDHTRYQDEVTERWGAEAYANGDAWWRSLSDEDKKGFQRQQTDISADSGAAMAAGLAPESDEVQAIAARHYEWITIGWQGRRPSPEEFTGLGDMYVTDPRFARNYDQHGEGSSGFVRDAMAEYAERNLR
jgi:MerR family transcriptional regulator, thiopeptide resistance regulator